MVTIDDLPFESKSYGFGKRLVNAPADNIMTDYADALMIAEHFKAHKVDALFVPFCNFGQEEALAKLAKELEVPTLVWGPRDPAPNGTGPRPTDSPMRHIRRDKGVAALWGDVYIYRELPRKCPGVCRWLPALCVHSPNRKGIRHARIAQISVRPQQFLSVMVNEAELLEKFGIEIVPISALRSSIR